MRHSDPPYGTPDQLTASLRRLCEFQAGLSFCTLEMTERRELNGRLFVDGPGLVMAVAWALGNAALQEQQGLAFAWLVLRDYLRLLAQMAGDTYLKIQAEAIKQAVAEVRPEKVHPPEQQLLLVPAYFIVHNYYQGLVRKREDRTRRRAAAGTPAPAPDKGRAAARKRSARTERAAHRARLDALFGRVLDQVD